ncbi:MAG: 4Fe-4S binding protein [candidate division NC10 bacterium]
MPTEVYKQLLEVMKKRGGPMAGMDIPEFFDMVEAMFTPEEAAVNNAMPRGRTTAKEMAELMGKDEKEVGAILESMADKGLCLGLTKDGKKVYQGERWLPGIFEYQLMPGKGTQREKTIANLIGAYQRAYGAKTGPGPGGQTFPTSRIITVDRTVEAENTVHTYDQMQTYIDKHDHIAASTCYCRHAADLRDQDIHGMPKDVCMQFGDMAQYAVEHLGARKLNSQEAREVLDRAEEAGLIHLSGNMTDDVGFVCNCDRWHCGPVTGTLAQAKPGLLLNSGFEPQFDPDQCTACETCIERCPPEALAMGDNGVPEVDLDRCFGCAVCATGCPTDAIAMVNKPGFPEPPADAKALREAIRDSRV